MKKGNKAKREFQLPNLFDLLPHMIDLLGKVGPLIIKASKVGSPRKRWTPMRDSVRSGLLYPNRGKKGRRTTKQHQRNNKGNRAPLFTLEKLLALIQLMPRIAEAIEKDKAKASYYPLQ